MGLGQFAALAALVLVQVWGVTPALARSAPDWLLQAAQSPASSGPDRGNAAVLIDEESITVGQDGTITCVRRRAVRIVTESGRDEAIGAQEYATDSGKLVSLEGWVISTAGAVRALGDKESVDLALVNNDVYNEGRIRSISGASIVVAGSVFGFESRVEDRSVLKEFEWAFQGRLPVKCSRLTVRAPLGWNVRAVWSNHEPLDPDERGGAKTWELVDLAAIPDEPEAPPLSALVPRIAVSVIPRGTVEGTVAFDDWTAAAAWSAALTNAQAEPTPALSARARELVAGGRGRIDSIRAVAGYVQRVNYISIQLGLGRGGGFRPRPAGQVFDKGYGDCKDKANLMRAMLGAVGIRSYLVFVYSGDRRYVREDWPALQQFNHCILAVTVADRESSSTIDHPAFKRLLFFDPTDPDTPLGNLPGAEQGSLGLLVAGEGGGLIRLPESPPGHSGEARENDISLAEDGSLHGVVRATYRGQSSVAMRRYVRSVSPADLREGIESWVTSGAPGSKVDRFEPADEYERDEFELTVEFSAPRYAKRLGNGLLLFRSTLLDRWDRNTLTDPVRHLPVQLDTSTFRERTRIVVPAGYEIEELPDSISMDTSFGHYSLRAVADQDPRVLVITRELTIRGCVLPLESYQEVRSFYERGHAAEQIPVVLKRSL